MAEKRRLTLEEAPDLNVAERTKLYTIWRRIEFLERRVVNHTRENPTKTGWRDVKEVEALHWILAQANLPAPTSILERR